MSAYITRAAPDNNKWLRNNKQTKRKQYKWMEPKARATSHNIRETIVFGISYFCRHFRFLFWLLFRRNRGKWAFFQYFPCRVHVCYGFCVQLFFSRQLTFRVAYLKAATVKQSERELFLSIFFTVCSFQARCLHVKHTGIKNTCTGRVVGGLRSKPRSVGGKIENCAGISRKNLHSMTGV